MKTDIIKDVKRSRLWIALPLAMLWSTGHSQVVTLDSVLAAIDRNNPALQEYENKAEAFRAYAEGASAWMAPMAGVGPFMTPYSSAETMPSQEGAWMISIEQGIPNPAKLKANARYIRSRGAVEIQNRAIAFNNLRMEAKLLYYQWLVAEKKLRVLKESSQVIELLVRLARIRYPYSQGSLGSIYKAEARTAEIENLQLMTLGEIDEKRYRLKSLMNLAPSDSIEVDTTTFVSFERLYTLYDTTVPGTRRSDLKQIDATIETMKLRQRVEGLKAKPDFTIRFDHMQSIGNMPNQFSAMAMISIPIAPWSSRMYKAEAKGIQHEIEALRKEREAILVTMRGTLAGMADRIARAETQLENYRAKIIPALRKNYQTLMLGYEENREQLPVVVDGWEAINAAEIEYIEKLGEYYTMIALYEKEVEK